MDMTRSIELAAVVAGVVQDDQVHKGLAICPGAHILTLCEEFFLQPVMESRTLEVSSAKVAL